MSSMINHLDYELKFVPQYADTRAYVVPILEVISEEGHSGHSFSWFANYLENWLKDPKDLGEPEDPDELFSIQRLIKPIWPLVKAIPSDMLERVAFILMRAVRQIPFTHLTGEDDEWVIHGYSCCYAQNKRMGAVFKDKNGDAYWIDGIVHGHPSKTFRWFLYYHGSYSRVKVTFPWDPETKTVLKHFSDDDMTVPLDVGDDPQQWLREARKRMRQGYHPISGKSILDFWITQDHVERTEVCQALRQFAQTKGELDEKEWDQAVTVLLDMEFESQNPEIAYIEHPVELTYGKEKLSFSNGRIARNFIRLVEEAGLENLTGIKLLPVIGNVLVPSKHYQRWDAVVNEAVLTLSGKNSNFYLDDGELLCPNPEVSFNHLKYLREKCKEKGLEYKGPKR